MELRFGERMEGNHGEGDVLVLTGRDVEKLLSMEEAIEVVERCFILDAEGKSVMPPKLYLELPAFNGDFRAMPAYIEGSAGIKWVSVYPGNRDSGLPSVMATIILSNPRTGAPLAIMDGTYITDLRTGAAGAVASKHLACRDAARIGMVGAGKQASMQLLALSRVMPRIEEVRVFDVDSAASARFALSTQRTLGLHVIPAGSVAEAADADILVTTTPSREPVVNRNHVRPGTHINAIGADAKGKQELESLLVKDCHIFVDNMEQACHSGEVNVPLSEGYISRGDIAGTIGEVLAGRLEGRRDNKEITLFDSTGLAIQDIACAARVYEKARAPGAVSGVD